MKNNWISSDYQKVEKAIEYISANYLEQPSLTDVADSVALSEFHFQRLFQKWAGVSPKKFLQYLTLEHAKTILNQSKDLLSSTYESGLSGPGRLHDLFVNIEAMTPGEYKMKGEGLQIRYGFHMTPFGLALIGIAERGICHLSFVDSAEKQVALREAKAKWPQAKFILDVASTRKAINTIFGVKTSPAEVKVLLTGSKFQLKVWEALLRIPAGACLSYKDFAQLAGHPGAARSVGSVLAENVVGFLIPCHRVIRSQGIIGEYRWGSARKRAMLAFEQAQSKNRTNLS